MMEHSVRPRTTTRAPKNLLAAAVVTAAALLAVLVAPGPAAFADTADHHTAAQTAVITSIERGTVAADLDAGRVSTAALEQLATTGFTANGHRVAPWADLDASSTTAAESTAGHLTRNDVRQVTSAPAASTGAAGGITESKHWWNNHEYFISGQVVRVIITVGAGVYLAAVCISLDLSKVSCAALGALVAGAAEFIKSGGCGRGYWFDFPLVWKSHCG
ncbi:hypothetical protein ACLBWP_06705 [Microbacterium sp. M1A1_1b]